MSAGRRSGSATGPAIVSPAATSYIVLIVQGDADHIEGAFGEACFDSRQEAEKAAEVFRFLYKETHGSEAAQDLLLPVVSFVRQPPLSAAAFGDERAWERTQDALFYLSYGARAEAAKAWRDCLNKTTALGRKFHAERHAVTLSRLEAIQNSLAANAAHKEELERELEGLQAHMESED